MSKKEVEHIKLREVNEVKIRKGPLYIVPWRCTFACDSNCVHCASASKPSLPDELNTENAMRAVDQAYDFGASFFGITGGEALLRKDLFQIIRYARKTRLKCKHNNRRSPPQR